MLWCTRQKKLWREWGYTWSKNINGFQEEKFASCPWMYWLPPKQFSSHVRYTAFPVRVSCFRSGTFPTRRSVQQDCLMRLIVLTCPTPAAHLARSICRRHWLWILDTRQFRSGVCCPQFTPHGWTRDNPSARTHQGLNLPKPKALAQLDIQMDSSTLQGTNYPWLTLCTNLGQVW